MVKQKKSSKELVTREQARGLVTSGGGAVELNETRLGFKKIKIFQSDRQYKYFGEKEVSPEDYGKLFLYERNCELKGTDLQKLISGVLLRYTRGYAVYTKQEKNGKIIPNYNEFQGSRPGILQNKQDWMNRYPDFIPENRVDIIMCTVDAQRAVNMTLSHETPWVRLVLTGAAYSAAFDLADKMKKALSSNPTYRVAMEEAQKKQERFDPVASIYTLKISSQKQKNEDGQEYFIPSIEVEATPPEIAEQFKPIAQKWGEITLYKGWEEEQREEVQEGETIEDKPKQLEGQIDDSDLPF